MKGLSVRQPHAERIASGIKTLEIRSRPTKHRGPLLICASKALPPPGDRRFRDLPRGVAICTVEVVGCRPFAPGDARAACVRWTACRFR